MPPRNGGANTAAANNNNAKIPIRVEYNFNETTDLSIVAWLAQYDPNDLPPILKNAFRLGPIQSSLCITQPIVWLANLSCDFKKAYNTVNDPHDVLGPTLGGRRNNQTGQRTFPREFKAEEQNRFDKLQDEYHNLRWRNLLNLGYDPATAATMVGAVRDKEQNLFSPPPLFALSPRMIVTDDSKRQSMRNVLIEYLDGKAYAAQKSLLEELEREESLLEEQQQQQQDSKKKGKNAKKKAKQKKKQQEAAEAAKQQGGEQKQEEDEQRQSQAIEEAMEDQPADSTPLNQEQLKYLREHQAQQRKDNKSSQNLERTYSENERQIIEKALHRTGLAPSVDATSTASAERIYKKKNGQKVADSTEDGEDDKKGEDSDDPCSDRALRMKQRQKQGLKYDEEVQSYAYAWCCDYCKTATFPTFAEAALHEAECPAYLELQSKVEEGEKEVKEAGDDGSLDANERQKHEGAGGGMGVDGDSSDQTTSNGGDSASIIAGVADTSAPEAADGEIIAQVSPRGESQLKATAKNEELAQNEQKPGDGLLAKECGNLEKVAGVNGDDAPEASEAQSIMNSELSSTNNAEDGARSSGSDSSSVAADEDTKANASVEPTPPTLTQLPSPPTENDWEGATTEGEWTHVAPSSKKKSSPEVTTNRKGSDKGGGTPAKNDAERKPPATTKAKAKQQAKGNDEQNSSKAKTDKKNGSGQAISKKNQKKGASSSEKKSNNGGAANQRRDTATKAQDENNASTKDKEVPEVEQKGSIQPLPPPGRTLADEDIVQMMKHATIDYDDRVNDTALPQPNNNVGQPVITPPRQEPPPETSTLPNADAVQPNYGLDNARLAAMISENEILTAQNNFLIEQNKSLLAEREDLKHQLAAIKQQSVEAVQQVQLKAYIAETARAAAEDRVAWLENLLADALANMAAEEVARREILDAVSGVASIACSSMQAQQWQQQERQLQLERNLLPPPQAMPSPQAMPPLGLRQVAYSLQQPLAISLQRQSPAASPMMQDRSLLPNLAIQPALPGGFHNDFVGNPLSQNQGNNNGFLGGLQDTASNNNDFWEPPWMIRNESPSPNAAGRESVLSRLRRGDHAS